MHREFNKSSFLYKEASNFIPGGVNSPVRAFKSVGAIPVFIEKGAGAIITDVDANDYIDYVGSWGPLVLGHRHPAVISALQDCLEKGTSFGAPTELETKLAQMIIDALPAMDMVRLVNSGTEATMSAIRLARGYTNRNKIVKFAGCYHGHADFLLIKAGSGALTLGVPTSPGVPPSAAENTINAPFNDLETLKTIFQEVGNDIAAIIVEPVPGNMGLIPPAPGFLAGLRQLTSEYGTLLIFDEVMTGFRLAYGGAQVLYDIEPDITCLGKIIGGGLPVGAYGGKKEIMSLISPLGPVYQAGTLSGNPLAVTAGMVTLKVLQQEGIYDELEEKSARLAAGLQESSTAAGMELTFNRVGSMLCTFFSNEPVTDFDSASRSDTELFAAYFRNMLKRGVYLAPSQFEAAFMSLAHTNEQIDLTIEAAYQSLKELRNE